MSLLVLTPFAHASETNHHDIPPVRNIWGERQLFLDDRFVTLKEVSLVMNPPYQDHEPIFVPEAPWEYRLHPYATVIKEGDRFRMWYAAYDWDPPPGSVLPDSGRLQDAPDFFTHVVSRLCYAESTDGVHWQRPDLGLVEYKGSRKNNILGPAEWDKDYRWAPGWGGGNVFIDPVAPPEGRYKLWTEVRSSDPQRNGLFGFQSADGLKWNSLAGYPIVGNADTLNVAFWDTRIAKYVGYSRLYETDAYGDRFRSVRRLLSDDFQNWNETGVVLAPDEIDRNLVPAARRRFSRQIMEFHGNCVFKLPGITDAYFALPETWWHWGPNPFPESGRKGEYMGGFPDKTDIPLATSRDGIAWERSGGRLPFLRLGPEGSADSKYIAAFPQPVEVGDELWIYYGGFRYGISEKVAFKRGGYFRARMRRDGFLSMDAPYTGGELITHPVRFAGSRLVLNADTSAGGAIRVELQDETGLPLAGYALHLADEVNGNSTRLLVTWNGKSELGALASRPVRLRFVMHSCKLYSYQFVEAGDVRLGINPIERTSAGSLHSLRDDLAEICDLFASRSEIADRLNRQFQSGNSQLSPPAWFRHMIDKEGNVRNISQQIDHPGVLAGTSQ